MRLQIKQWIFSRTDSCDVYDEYGQTRYTEFLAIDAANCDD